MGAISSDDGRVERSCTWRMGAFSLAVHGGLFRYIRLPAPVLAVALMSTASSAFESC